MSPDFDETERANATRADVEAQYGFAFDDFEVTNIRHVLHQHDAPEIRYIAHALRGGGNWVIIDFTWTRESNSSRLNAAADGSLQTELVTLV